MGERHSYFAHVLECFRFMGSAERYRSKLPVGARIAGSLALAASAVYGCSAKDSKSGPSELQVNVDSSQTTCDSQFCPIPTGTQIPVETFKPKVTETAVPAEQEESGAAIARFYPWEYRHEAW